MDIITIEKEVFEEMLRKQGLLISQIETLRKKHQDRVLDEWLDGEAVCSILEISPRTLQTYRDTGKISFSQINHKIYYRSADISHLLKRKIINNQ